jgi:hypothetical protein
MVGSESRESNESAPPERGVARLVLVVELYSDCFDAGGPTSKTSNTKNGTEHEKWDRTRKMGQNTKNGTEQNGMKAGKSKEGWILR